MMMGCSWACGEWGHGKDGEYQVLHPGTQQYLSDAGHSVTSIAEGGCSNWAQLDRISPHHALQRDRHSGGHLADADVLLWFLTDPFRDIHARMVNTMEMPRTLAEWHLRRRELLEASFDSMRRLAGDRAVWLVGGVGEIPTWVPRRHPGWRVIVPDLLRWLLPASRVSATHLNRIWRYGDCDAELLDYHEIEEQRQARFRWRAEHRPDSEEHRLFWPDGGHPNREAHRLLTERLILPSL